MEEILAPEAINNAQHRFDLCLREQLPEVGLRSLGYRGGGERLNLYTRGRGQLYYSTVFINRPGTSPRYWNAFGFYDGNSHGQQRIVVEINIPQPPSRRVAGYFAQKPGTGEIYLLHDGRVGGGKEGVGRQAFLEYCASTVEKVTTTRGRTGVLISPLAGPDLVERISSFARLVDEFKANCS